MKLNLGNQIRINRRRMNLTQEQLAEKFGTSPQAISRWEIGATYPDIEMLPMIASFFEMSVDALLGVTEEEKAKFCIELQQSFETAVVQRMFRKLSISCEKYDVISKNISTIGFGDCIPRFGKSVCFETRRFSKKCVF